MSEKRAVIFPGQGAQSVGMAADVFEHSAAARDVFARAANVVGYDLAEICFAGPADRLERTDVQQPAILVASAAIWAALRDGPGQTTTFTHAGGLSLGEYTALYAAGAIALEDAVRVVHRRGQLMQEAAEAADSGMVSLVGIEDDQATQLCAEVAEGDVLVPANFNCPGQVVISGSKAACARAVEAAERFGCRAVPLAVAGAFHSPLMASAAEGLRSVLAEVPFKPPTMSVVANVDGAYHTSADAIRESLARQVTSPVRWTDCIRRMIGDGVTRFTEVGPGRTLTGMMRRIDRSVDAAAVNNREAIEKFAQG